MNRPGLPALFLCLVIAGCTMAPQYERPSSPVSPDWPAGGAYGTHGPAGPPGTVAADVAWRDFFGDARLQRLIELALGNNRDLRVAALNVEAAQSQYRIARSYLLPDVGVTGTASRQHLASGSVASGGGGGSPTTFNRFSLTVNAAAYELDLFGRIRSLKEKALEQYLATDEARISAQISLVAAVATQYLTQRELEEDLEMTRRTLESVQAYHDLLQKSFELGNASELEVSTAEAQVQSARSNVAGLTRLLAQAENALVVLVGQSLPADLPAARTLSSQKLIADLPAGLPSDLLERRPDILAAEHALKAANANIGAARAAFFPRVLLTGSAGFSSTELASLFTPNAQTWAFVPQITVPIFENAYNQANLDLAHVEKRIEIANYEKTIQTAFREVSDALAGRQTFDIETDANEKLVEAQRRRYTLADARYRNGLDSYLSVLIAQQDLYAAELRLAQSRFAQLANLVSLYKALGGGWN
jgi:multidrug efflux system outer membrane protein